MPQSHASEVMVVEDDAAIRETLQELLEEQGYRVVGASNGVEALASLKGRTPRLILLDLMMPVMDGIEFRDAQRNDPDLASIPVVVISADHSIVQKVSEMAVEGFLAKPFELEELLELVRRYCRAPARNATPPSGASGSGLAAVEREPATARA